jgi:hypothetical protein
MKCMDNVRRKCRAHQKRQLGIANNGGPEEISVKHFMECFFLILMGIVNHRNLPFHMPIVCSLFK